MQYTCMAAMAAQDAGTSATDIQTGDHIAIVATAVKADATMAQCDEAAGGPTSHVHRNERSRPQ